MPARNVMAARIYVKKELRGKNYVFKDRVEAGRMLAEMLAPKYKDAQNSMVLAIPSGGVPVALQVRRKLNCPFDLIIVRKIPIPHNPETIQKIEPMVDEIYCPNVRAKIFFAVADAYGHWYELSREKVLELLAENRP